MKFLLVMAMLLFSSCEESTFLTYDPRMGDCVILTRGILRGTTCEITNQEYDGRYELKCPSYIIQAPLNAFKPCK